MVYIIKVLVYCTVYWTVYPYTQAHSVNKTRAKGTCRQTLSGMGTLEGTVTRVPANAFIININSINGNTSIKADFS